MEDNHPLRILFVEDVPADAELAARALRQAGLAFTSSRVETKDAFLAALAEFQPDLIISDYAMPEFDGMQALQLSLAHDATLPFIIMTSRDEETAVACMKAGATDYVIKQQMTRLPFAVKEALEQKKARLAKEETERALRESEERFRSILDNIQDGYFEVDTAGNFTFFNPALVRMLGRPAHELMGMNDRRYMTPEGGKAVFRIFNRIFRTGIPEQALDWGLVRPDGTLRSVEVSVSLIKAADGSINGFRGTVRDITERKQAEEALRAGEAQYRLLAENMSDTVWLMDMNLRTIYISPSVIRTRGYTLDEVNALPLDQQMTPDSLTRAMELFGEALSPENLERPDPRATYSVELEFYRKGGSKFWSENTFTLILDQNKQPINLLGTGRDITERKRAEEALHEAEERFRVIFEHANDAIHITNADGEILTVNSRMCELMGYTREELLMMRVADLQAPEVRQSGIVVKEELARHGNALFEGLNLHSSGRRIPVEISVACIARPQGDWYVSIVRDITERKRAEEALRQQLEHLQALRVIDQAIASSFDLRITLDILLDQTVSQLGIDAAVVLLLDPYQHTLKFSAGRGFRTRAIEAANLRLGEGFAGQVALERRLVQEFDVETVGQESPFAKLWSTEGFKSYQGIPLIAKGQVKGVLEVFHRTDFTPDAEWIEFLETLGGQAAIAIDNAQLFAGLQQANQELGVAYDATIEGWSRAMDLRDKETEGHTQRVTEITLALARAMGMDERATIHLRRGALLHDIGKMGIPDGILLKPGKLTDEEWIIMHKHPQFAREMLVPITYLRQSLDIPYCHHEKWDGTGYPQGLRGERIPLAARIFAIVDVWDALMSDRPYRKAWTRPQTLTYIREQNGKHFDPQVVEAFIQKLESDSI